MYYVYALLDSTKPNNIISRKWNCRYFPFYIGKGKDYRAYDHFSDSTRMKDGKYINNLPVHRKIRKLLRNGIQPIVEIIFRCEIESVALEVESYLINFFGVITEKNGILYNIVKDSTKYCGGDTLTHHPNRDEICKRISLTMKEKGTSAGKNNPCYGLHGKDHPAYGHKKKLTEESKELIRNAAIERAKSPDYKNGMSGRKHSQSAIDKMSECAKKRCGGSGNPRAKKYIVISPDNQEFIVFGRLKKFCEEHSLSYYHMSRISRGKEGEYNGWKVEERNSS